MTRRVLKMSKWVLFSTYLGKRIITITVGKMLPEIEVEWLVAALLVNTSIKVEIFQFTKTQQL